MPAKAGQQQIDAVDDLAVEHAGKPVCRAANLGSFGHLATLPQTEPKRSKRFPAR